MKLAVSNIAWNEQDDGVVLDRMKTLGFSGLEIAPLRVFSEECQERYEEAEIFRRNLLERRGLEICSMQSIWFGIKERLFGSSEERSFLKEHTKKTILLAKALQCENIVFGSPKNRVIADETQRPIAIEFFREIGNYAFSHGTVIAIEANPAIYQTNFLNTTREAVDFVREVASPGVKLNFDVGTLLVNEENIDHVENFLDEASHIHISEPLLEPVQKRDIHARLAHILSGRSFNGYVSIEMKRQETLGPLFWAMGYVAELFS